jgi:hypothetical protein
MLVLGGAVDDGAALGGCGRHARRRATVAVPADVVRDVRGLAVPAVREDRHRGGARAGGEVDAELLEAGGARGPGGGVGAAGAGRADVDVGALHPHAERVRGVGLHADGLRALGVVAVGRDALQRGGAGVHRAADRGTASGRAAPAGKAALEAGVGDQVGGRGAGGTGVDQYDAGDDHSGGAQTGEGTLQDGRSALGTARMILIRVRCTFHDCLLGARSWGVVGVRVTENT